MIEDNSGWENFLHSACAGGNVDNVDVSKPAAGGRPRGYS